MGSVEQVREAAVSGARHDPPADPPSPQRIGVSANAMMAAAAAAAAASPTRNGGGNGGNESRAEGTAEAAFSMTKGMPEGIAVEVRVHGVCVCVCACVCVC